MKNFRIKCNISASVVEALQEFANQNKMTLAVALTRTIDTMCFLQSLHEEGGKFFVLKEDKLSPITFDFILSSKDEAENSDDD